MRDDFEPFGFAPSPTGEMLSGPVRKRRSRVRRKARKARQEELNELMEWLRSLPPDEQERVLRTIKEFMDTHLPARRASRRKRFH